MNFNEDYIRQNIDDLRKKVARAAIKSGRSPEDIKIVAVTKTVQPEKISIAIDEGLIDLGENRVQELCEKYDKISSECNWHLIGHLQTNKVKYLIDKISLLHSVDRIALVDEIQKRAEKIEKIVKILVQVNIAKEESKFGIGADKVIDFIKTLSIYPNIKVKGLMTMAPNSEEPENIRWVFRDLRKLYIDIAKENIHNIDMELLSMGMSNDFQVAIEEGSNIIRVGTAIFGERQ